VYPSFILLIRSIARACVVRGFASRAAVRESAVCAA
jgi:hypothetical protein